MKYFLLIYIFLFLSCKKNDSENKTVNIQNIEFQKEQKFKIGQNLFSENCASCHSNTMYQKMTAPALGGVTLRRDKKWLYSFTRNSIKMYDNSDSLAVKIRNEYGNSLMPSFNFSDKELDAIYFYIENKYAQIKE